MNEWKMENGKCKAKYKAKYSKVRIVPYLTLLPLINYLIALGLKVLRYIITYLTLLDQSTFRTERADSTKMARNEFGEDCTNIKKRLASF